MEGREIQEGRGGRRVGRRELGMLVGRGASRGLGGLLAMMVVKDERIGLMGFGGDDQATSTTVGCKGRDELKIVIKL